MMIRSRIRRHRSAEFRLALCSTAFGFEEAGQDRSQKWRSGASRIDAPSSFGVRFRRTLRTQTQSDLDRLDYQRIAGRGAHKEERSSTARRSPLMNNQTHAAALSPKTTVNDGRGQ